MATTRGDLVVMSPSENPISTLIREYDRSNFTHVGIDVGDGSVVNCRTDAALLGEWEDGGVRLDRYAEIADRRCYRVPVVVDTDRKEAAVETALGWVEAGGHGSRSAFSLPKMFQCAVAVDASRPDADFTEQAREHMLDAAFAAARAWAYDPGDPSFFCAEMVVVAYGWSIPQSLLAPPDRVPDDDELRFLEHVDVSGLVDAVQRAWTRGVRATTLAGVIAAVAVHDPGFLRGAGAALWEWLHRPNPEPEEVRGRSDTDPLPAALVTPRMLMRSEYTGEIDPVPIV